MVKLSQRLQDIADCVPEGARLADIGSDHALLPTFLVQRGTVPFAVAGEVNRGPMEAAAKQVREAGLTGRIDVRLGDGLAVVAPGEVDAVTIAGMGGALIASILEAGKAKLAGVRTLVLQPNVGEDSVRRWLSANGWLLVGERILEEDGKIYEILTALRADSADDIRRADALYEAADLGNGLTLSGDLLYRMGPYLIREASDVWAKKWDQELNKLAYVREQVLRSELESARAKAEELQADMERIREVVECLRKDRR